MPVDSPTAEQQAKIDAHILTGEILLAIRLIMGAFAVNLRAAMDINRARYEQLRRERAAEFTQSDAEYWSGYSECVFDAIARDL